MQQIALFRKLIINNKPYYQFCDIKNNSSDEQFAKFQERDQNDYFYLPIDNEALSIYQKGLYMIILTDSTTPGKMEQLDINSDKFINVLNQFRNNFKDFDLNIVDEDKIVEDLYSKLKKRVSFQDEALTEILKTLDRNFTILESDIPKDNQWAFKDNILLYGASGNGKNTIIEALKSCLDIPYADLTLTDDFEGNVNSIVTQLIRTAHGNLEGINNGIVYVRDNYEELINYNSSLIDNPYLPLFKLLKGVRLRIGEQQTELYFENLTFIIALDVPDIDDLENYMIDFSRVDNLHYVHVKSLNTQEQKKILLQNQYSVINLYRRVLKENGKRLVVKKDFVDELIIMTRNIQEDMHFMNTVISKMIKNEWHNGDTIILTKEKLNKVIQLFDDIDFSGYDQEEEEDDYQEAGIKDDISHNDTKPTSPSKIIMTDELSVDLDKLLTVIKQNICAQDEHIKRLLYTILRNRRAAWNKELANPKRYIKNILIRGESGSGKTAILNEISKLLNMPIFIADATSYTEAGYVGGNVNDMLASLYKNASDDLEKAERGILVIDEIDKKALQGADTSRDVSREAVLNGLLKIIEGAVIPIEIGKGQFSKQIMFDTSRLTVICSGAFEDIEKIRDQRLGVKKTVGFGNTSQMNNQQDPNIIDEDYVKYGMSRQFMGRLGVIVNLNKLMPKDLETIMRQSKISELAIQQKLSSFDDLELVYEDGFYEELAQKAFQKKIGARGIEKAFNEVLNKINYIDIDPTIYQKVIFTRECINDPSKIVLVKRVLKREITKVKKPTMSIIK